MEADGGSCGTRDVACCRGELKCDGGKSRREMRIWTGSCSLTSNWKRKSSGNAACHQKKPAVRPCALSAIPLLFASTLALCGVGTDWRIFFEIYGSASALYCGRLAFP